MLVDTGSAVTIVRENVWEEANNGIEQPLQACTDPIVAANGEELLIRGKFNVTLQVGGIR